MLLSLREADFCLPDLECLAILVWYILPEAGEFCMLKTEEAASHSPALRERLQKPLKHLSCKYLCACTVICNGRVAD